MESNENHFQELQKKENSEALQKWQFGAKHV